MRALALKETNKDKYSQFINLEAHDKNKENKRLDEFLETARFVKRFFKLDGVEDEEIARIAGIIQVMSIHLRIFSDFGLIFFFFIG